MSLTVSNIVQANKETQWAPGISVLSLIWKILYFLPQFQFLRKSQSQLAYTRETVPSIVTVLTQDMLILLSVAKILVKGLTFTDDRRYSDI